MNIRYISLMCCKLSALPFLIDHFGHDVWPLGNDKDASISKLSVACSVFNVAVVLCVTNWHGATITDSFISSAEVGKDGWITIISPSVYLDFNQPTLSITIMKSYTYRFSHHGCPKLIKTSSCAKLSFKST